MPLKEEKGEEKVSIGEPRPRCMLNEGELDSVAVV